MKHFGKTNLFLGVPLALLSLKLYFGMVLGYMVASFVAPRVQFNVFHFGRYRVHLHHWILGFVGFPLALNYDLFPFSVQLVLGFLGGVIIQDFLCDSDWRKIIVKKPKRNA